MENLRFRLAMPNYIVNPGNPTDILTGFLDMLYFSIQPEYVSKKNWTVSLIFVTYRNAYTNFTFFFKDVFNSGYLLYKA